MDAIWCNKELPEEGNRMTWDITSTWPFPWSPLASVVHWMPEHVFSSFGCKSKQLSLVSFSFPYRMEASLALGAWFKTELSLSISQAGKKCEQKLLLSVRSLWSWPLFWRRSLEGSALLMWIHWGSVLLRGKPSIITHSPGLCFPDDYIMSRLDIQLCISPGETNGTPLVD